LNSLLSTHFLCIGCCCYNITNLLFVASKVSFRFVLVSNTETKFNRPSRPTSGQFHQHFKNSFCANIFATKKLQSKTVTREKLKKHFCTKKGACNMLMKLTTGIFLKPLYSNCASHCLNSMNLLNRRINLRPRHTRGD